MSDFPDGLEVLKKYYMLDSAAFCSLSAICLLGMLTHKCYKAEKNCKVEKVVYK